MALIQLPEYIYTGIDSMGYIFDNSYKKFLVLSDTQMKKSSLMSSFFQKVQKHSVKAEHIFCDNPAELFNLIQERLVDETPDLIIAVGDGKIIDCAMAVSSISCIPYCAVPQVAPTALWESDSTEAQLNRKIPLICALDPDMIVNAHSAKIAYEGLGMLALCAESFSFAKSQYVKSVAETAFCRIFENLFDAFRGEISARESLLEGMYWAHISYVNSHEFSWESPCYRLCEFFRPFGIDGLSLLATSCVQLIKGVFLNNESALQQLAQKLNITPQSELSGLLLVEKIRQLRAKLSVPSCIKNIGADEERFLLLSDELSEDDKAIFFDCYYSDYFNSKLEEQVFRGG